MTGEHSETILSETDVLELDIFALLQSPEAVAAFDTYAPLITARTAPRFADLLRMINSLAAAGDFAAAVDAAVFAAVRSPVDITRLDAFGALSTTDPILKVAAVQMLRTIHEAAESPAPGDVR
ncbi:MAG: hypothetical protein WBD41_06815 [Rhodococcus sp. (in: high G+C Gram-positive bacteria)]|jgi:hypothetical protein|uniref:hypothetical protein n=1 Tax=Rhodococcus sp. 14-2496-1d TaxID=2023146 RepID=UPI000B9C3F10|nr:hypothetical protein [Rhodococcus sp. 14-2496-1d]OZF36978.1 hypothetical protein CH296_05230 [Rhodococcus sp. 14-2496-1d]